MKKKELGLGALLLGIVSYACLKGMQADNAKLGKHAAQNHKNRMRRAENTDSPRGEVRQNFSSFFSSMETPA